MTPMLRLVGVVLLAAGLGGFALGWFVLSSPGRPLPPPPGQPPAAPGPVSQRFPLLPADMHIDRETPAVAADSRGRVLLAWASETAEAEHTLWLARSADGGATFAEPAAFRKVPIYRYTATTKGKEVARATSVAPRLAAVGDVIYLGWTEAAGGGPHVDFFVAHSADGGQTFSAPACVHGADAVRPGFTALRAGADGLVACSWLDGRHKAQQPFCSIAEPGGDRFHPDEQVYAGPTGGVCPCCDMDVVRSTGGGMFVGFRNNDDDYRDICVARWRGAAGGFDPPVMVNRERWRFNGCPHDGPSLALGQDRLHVLWMDAHTGRRRVYHASSALDALSFEPRELAPAAPGEQGHPRLVAAADGSLHAAWDGSLEDVPPSSASGQEGHDHHAPPAGGRAVMYARSGDGGNSFTPPRIVALPAGAFQVNPALAVGLAGDVFLAWNELADTGKSVVFVRIPAGAK
jgi:hypothetical protein